MRLMVADDDRWFGEVLAMWIVHTVVDLRHTPGDKSHNIL